MSDDGARIPIVSMFGNLFVTVRGAPTDREIAALREDVTALIERHDARGLILDLSGVHLLDTYLTRAIRDLAVLARLMGVETAVCGMRPSVAITIVDMGLALQGVHSALNLERAVELLDELARVEDDAAAREDDGESDGAHDGA